MTRTDLPLDPVLRHLQLLARRSLLLWDVPADASVRLINVSENATFLVQAPGGYRSILRVHRENYHSRRAIECELAWAAALEAETGVICPRVIPGRNGAAIQQGRVEGLTAPRFMVMFAFFEGVQPREDQDLVEPFRVLGRIAATAHRHAIHWRRPEPFERLKWDLDAVFGAAPIWGDWRDGPNMSAPIRAVLERVEATLRRRLSAFGEGPDRYGLIHADMRLANLLIDGDTTKLIDFDDCGFGWFLYDFAAAVSFMEDHPQIPALRDAWVEAYRRIRPLPDAGEAEIDSFILLRRLALLAWIGSHSEAPEPQALAPDFARVSAELGEAYLSRFG